MTDKLLRNQRIHFLLVLWAISCTCSGQSSNATAQSAPGIKTGTSLNSLSRMASLDVREAEKVQHYVVWRVPLPVGGPAKNEIGLEDVAYLVVRENPEDSHVGEVLWYRTAYIREPQFAPFVHETLSWNPQKRRLYLVETTSLSGHGRVRVYEIDLSTTYGTYPPLVFKTTSQKSDPSSNPIVAFDPAEPGHIFLGNGYVQAIAEPDRLLISIWNMPEFGVTQFASYFIVDLDSQSWKRVSLR